MTRAKRLKQEEADRSLTETEEDVLKRRQMIHRLISYLNLPGNWTHPALLTDRDLRSKDKKFDKFFLYNRWLKPQFDRGRGISVVGDGVSVRRSTLPGIGSGLFADKDFEVGDLITEFIGNIVHDDSARKLADEGRATHIVSAKYGNLNLDGSASLRLPHGLGGGHFANDGRFHPVEGMPAPGTNAKQFWREDKSMAITRVFLVATRPIEAGDEIFTTYGEEYWARHASQH